MSLAVRSRSRAPGVPDTITMLLVALAVSGCGSATHIPAPSAPGLATPQDSVLVPATTDLGDITNLVVVALTPGTSAQDLASQTGALVVRQTDTGYATMQPALGPASALAATLRLDPRVRAADVDTYLMPAEERQQSQAFDKGNGSPTAYQGQEAADNIGLALAHRLTEGQGTLIAVLDTGAELTHPALAGHIVASRDFVGTSIDGHEQGDGIDNDGDGFVDEALGHGTHVAGIAALVAPRAGLLIGRVLDADGRGDIFSIVSGIAWATANGAQVINMSFGMLESSTVIEYALAQADSLGTVCVAAAGNEGAQGQIEYPGSSAHVIAVAAVDDADLAAAFTSAGPGVAISAPGVNIRSAFLGGTYALWSGTSMAAPFVSGTAGMLRALHSGWHRDAVVARLASTVRSLAAANPALWPGLGVGGLDAGEAINRDAPWVIRGAPRGRDDGHTP